MTRVRTSLTRQYKRDMPSTQIVDQRRGMTAGQVGMVALAFERAGGKRLSDGMAMAKAKLLWSCPRIAVCVDDVMMEAGNPHYRGLAWTQELLDQTARAMRAPQ